MKCPKCGETRKAKEGLVCNCGFNFVFDPNEDKGMTGGLFAAIINRASSSGTYFFDESQLYAVYYRRNRQKGRIGRIIFTLAAVILGLLFLLSVFGVLLEDSGVLLFVLFVIALVLRLASRRGKTFSRQEFHGLLQRWLSFHPEEKLITEPRLQTPPPEWQEPDIYDYGAERVLIVEHDLMVDLLVLNGFHAQEKALVLSKNGYPEYLVPRIQEALRASPDLPVFYLHDAAPFEASPVESLTRSLPWLEGRQVIDLGLTMDDAKSLPALKALPAGEWQGVIPAAAVLFVVLSPLLTSALEGNMSLAHVLADVQDSGGGFFGGDFG